MSIASATLDVGVLLLQLLRNGDRAHHDIVNRDYI